MINIKIYRNHLLLLGAGFSFSTLAVFSEIATRLHVDGFNQMIWRTIFAAILSFFVLGLAGFFFIRSTRKLKRISSTIENLENLV